MIWSCRARPRADPRDDDAAGAATLHLDTSRDVTPRARLGAAGGAPGTQEGLLEPRNTPVQVLSGSAPGKATSWGREKWV